MKRNNIQQHLLSAYEQRSLNNILRYYEIDNYFENIIGLDNIYADGKAHLAQDLIKRINSNGSLNNVLLIGDTIHDYEVAKEIRSDCILISHGHQDEARLRKLNIPVAKNFAELAMLLV